MVFFSFGNHDPAFFLKAGDHSFDRLIEINHFDSILGLARRQQRRLVDDICQVGADKSRRLGSQ